MGRGKVIKKRRRVRSRKKKRNKLTLGRGGGQERRERKLIENRPIPWGGSVEREVIISRKGKRSGQKGDSGKEEAISRYGG